MVWGCLGYIMFLFALFLYVLNEKQVIFERE